MPRPVPKFAAEGRSHDTAPPAQDSPAPRTAAPPTSLGAAVAALLARWPEAPEIAPAHPLAPTPPARGSLADTPLGPMIEKLVAQSSGRPAPSQSAAARQFGRAPVEFGAATAAAVAQWLASQAPAPADRPTGGGAAPAGQGPSLLARLVAGLDPPAPSASRPATPPRQPAPRARPRLTAAASPEPGAQPGKDKDAPAGDPLPGQEAGELAQQLNRLLLDQAWLRGVDLT
jgi:hypothetical protein